MTPVIEDTRQTDPEQLTKAPPKSDVTVQNCVLAPVLARAVGVAQWSAIPSPS